MSEKPKLVRASQCHPEHRYEGRTWLSIGCPVCYRVPDWIVSGPIYKGKAKRR